MKKIGLLLLLIAVFLVSPLGAAGIGNQVPEFSETTIEVKEELELISEFEMLADIPAAPTLSAATGGNYLLPMQTGFNNWEDCRLTGDS